MVCPRIAKISASSTEKLTRPGAVFDAITLAQVAHVERLNVELR
jgi:hypothetical protein